MFIDRMQILRKSVVRTHGCENAPQEISIRFARCTGAAVPTVITVSRKEL
jgi:hypothetical protein